MTKPIFSESFLHKYLYDFRLSSIPNIRQINMLVINLIKELESGKFDSLKEEEIKSRFVSTFFGDILNFNYGNANEWMLREEKKSKTDGTKPDAVLGYFFINKSNDDVRVAIEIKDAKTDLDLKQKRTKSLSPVEQAYDYVSKMGGNCKWVIISNIREIRIYPSLDRSKCQIFYLKDLNKEEKLKELLFLFHKDRFLKFDLKEKSNTDKLFDHSIKVLAMPNSTVHIIDKIYDSLKRFEELGFINPDYLASIKPFNILDEYVWHYHDYKLFTLNPEIYYLFQEIEFKESDIFLSEKLKAEIRNYHIIEAKEKLMWSFKFLNNSMITEIEAVKDYQQEIDKRKNSNTIGFSHKHVFWTDDSIAIKVDIDLRNEAEICDCIVCNYRNFEFEKLIKKLKVAEGNNDYNNLNYALGNFLVSRNDYKTSYNILKSIRDETKQQSENGITYFFASLNTTFLYNHFNIYSLDDRNEIRNEIKAIDLDKTIYNELEFYLERDVIEYLKKIRDNDLIYKVQDEVEKLLNEIKELKNLIDDGGSMTGADYAYNLIINYQKLCLHFYNNSIFYIKFGRYKNIVEKILEALLISHNTPGYGVQDFDEFVLGESILNIPRKNLQKLLKKQKVISANKTTVNKLLNKLYNCITSYLNEGFLKHPYENHILAVELNNWDFKQLYTSIFTNSFTLLSKISMDNDQLKNIARPLRSFLEIENILVWYDIEELSNFISKKGHLFDIKDLEAILIIAIRRDEQYSKYDHLLNKIPKTIKKNYPDYKFSNKVLIRRAILNCQSENNINSDYRKIIYLTLITDENCTRILLDAFNDFLEEYFEENLYSLLLRYKILNIEDRNYFFKYIVVINDLKNKQIAYKFGDLQLTDLVYINFILLIYHLNIDFEKKEFEVFTNLNPFETWLLNPQQFDYNQFDIRWLLEVKDSPVILKRFAGIEAIIKSVDISLLQKYDADLAKIKYKYLLQ